MTRRVEADYLVIGAGATGMAFTDALIDHADVRVALVDRRRGVGGHWLESPSERTRSLTGITRAPSATPNFGGVSAGMSGAR